MNAGAKLYRKFNNKHLEPLAGEVVGEDGVYLLVRTSQSNIHVAQAARTQAFVDGQLRAGARRIIDEPGYIGQEITIDLRQGETLVLEKLASLYTSRDQAISECGLAARKAIACAGRFDALMAEHVLAWKHLWRRFDVHLQPAEPGFKLNVPMLLRLNMFHLLQAVSPNSIGLDIGVPARGWTGEAYQGHIFWDELFIFPFVNYRMPEITRSLLHVSLPASGRGARGGAKRGLSGRDVSLAKRQRRTGGNAGAQPEPALAALGAGQLVPAAPCGQRHRVQRLAVLSSHARRRVSALPRRRADSRHRALLVEHGDFQR